MTKLRFYFILCKDEETLLRADETDVTIVLHSVNSGNLYGILKFLLIVRGKNARYLLSFLARYNRNV